MIETSSVLVMVVAFGVAIVQCLILGALISIMNKDKPKKLKKEEIVPISLPPVVPVPEVRVIEKQVFVPMPQPEPVPEEVVPEPEPVEQPRGGITCQECSKDLSSGIVRYGKILCNNCYAKALKEQRKPGRVKK